MGKAYYFRKWRQHRGYTLDDLSYISGLSVPAISQVELGKNGFSIRTLEKLAEALKVDPGDLLDTDPEVNAADWKLWRRVRSAPPQLRNAIVAVVKTMLDSA